MVCVRWSHACLHGFVLHSVCAATVTLDLHFHMLSMLANTPQPSLLYCSSHCIQHIDVSGVTVLHVIASYVPLTAAAMDSEVITDNRFHRN